MKTIIVKRTGLLVLFTGILFSILFIACSKENNNGNSQTYTTSGDASGSQQSPPVTSSGSGRMTGTYNATTNVWNYSISWSSLSSAATLIEIHGPADIGVNGNLLFSVNIAAGGISGTASGSTTLTADQEASLLANKCYYTIIDALHVTGEIRGQIYATAQ